MKTIVEKSTSISKYLLNDTEVVLLNEDNIVVGDPPKFIIGDLNVSTATVYKGVTAPVDWAGNKYTFDGTDWTLNPDWADPTAPEELTAE